MVLYLLVAAVTATALFPKVLRYVVADIPPLEDEDLMMALFFSAILGFAWLVSLPLGAMMWTVQRVHTRYLPALTKMVFPPHDERG